MQGMEDTVWRVGCYNINPTTPNGQEGFTSLLSLRSMFYSKL